ncbi:MAG TPA: FAD-dependent oxidoreductase [Acidimicrobiales bacterium]|nr:FAD-dependent oxidoreductase [Acidimicrobiales bacterium]
MSTTGLRAVVVGGGLGGLGSALALARAGHRVTLLERDPLPPAADPGEAFRAERQGAPQSHQTHGFLARLQVLLRDRFPDVMDRLLALGCTTMSSTASLGEPRPGDEDLAVLIVRRTTLDWVLREAVLAQPGVEVRSSVAVAGLVADASPASGGPPAVRGVRLGDGGAVEGDVVVLAGGRRSPVPAWLAGAGATIPEEVVESGLMYFTRWYRFPDGPQALRDPKLGGDLGFLKFLGVPGDGETLSVTLAVATRDAELRAALGAADRFDLACRVLPGPDGFFADGPLEPLTGVMPMGGLLNRLRRFVDDDGHPLALGVHAVGDAHTCTNPLYGRGCTLAMVQAVLLADALADHPGDPAARAAAYEAGCAREVEPWYRSALELDRAGADPTGRGGAGLAGSEQGRAMAAVFVAAATDPVLGRALVRFWNLLVTPAEMMADSEVTARMAEVMAHPEDYPLPAPVGPTREELLAALADPEEARHA